MFLWGKLLERSFPHTPFKNFIGGEIYGKIGMTLRCSKQQLPQARGTLPTRSTDVGADSISARVSCRGHMECSLTVLLTENGRTHEGFSHDFLCYCPRNTDCQIFSKSGNIVPGSAPTDVARTKSRNCWRFCAIISLSGSAIFCSRFSCCKLLYIRS